MLETREEEINKLRTIIDRLTEKLRADGYTETLIAMIIEGEPQEPT